MQINSSIFKSYDIRGRYPQELNDEIAFKVGEIFAWLTKNKKVVVGRDGRLSSESLFNNLIKGLMKGGTEVISIGKVPTECLYFSVANYDFSGGVMITASHNPKEYNGFKMLIREDSEIKVMRGKEMLAFFENKPVFLKNEETNTREREIKQKDIWHDFIVHILSLCDISSFLPLRVVVDTSNGVASEGILRVQDKLPVEIIPLNFEIDGNFSAHGPNPLEEGASEQISKKIKETKADLGFIFDGDGDRVFLLDEKGELVRADITLLLLAKYFLNKHPGSKIVYNVICSKAVPEFIKKWGGEAIVSPVGFVNIREYLLKNKGVMAGELSGHYCFRDHFYFDSGLLTMLILLEVFSKDKRAVSEIIKEFSLYAKSPEINFKTLNKEEVLNKIKQKYADGRQSYLDGVTVEYKDWWFNIRASNTEPLIRLTIEALNEELLREKEKELREFIERG